MLPMSCQCYFALKETPESCPTASKTHNLHTSQLTYFISSAVSRANRLVMPSARQSFSNCYHATCLRQSRSDLPPYGRHNPPRPSRRNLYQGQAPSVPVPRRSQSYVCSCPLLIRKAGNPAGNVIRLTVLRIARGIPTVKGYWWAQSLCFLAK